MQKIPTMFVRDESVAGHPVMNEWKPECYWVRDGEGVPTVKMDGTNVKIEHGELLKRQKPKERDYDDAAYVPCRRDDPSDRFAFEAFDAGHDGDGIYELLGPKVQGNPHGFVAHRLMRVVPVNHSMQFRQSFGTEAPRTFEGLRDFFKSSVGAQFEGLVFHHPDGRMAKIKRRDFGLKWPAK